MTQEPVSGITSDDPDVTRILAAMSTKSGKGPTGGPGGRENSSARALWWTRAEPIRLYWIV